MLKTCLSILYTAAVILSIFTTSTINAASNPIIIINTTKHHDNLRKLAANLQSTPEYVQRFKVYRTPAFPTEIDTPEQITVQNNWFLNTNNTFQIDENTILIADAVGAAAALRIAETHKVFGIVLIYPKESSLKPYFFNWNTVKSNAVWIMEFALKTDIEFLTASFETEQLPVASHLAGDNFKLHYYSSNDETIDSKIMSEIVVCITEKQDAIDHAHVIVQAQTTTTIPSTATTTNVASSTPTPSNSPSVTLSTTTTSPSSSSLPSTTSTVITSSPTTSIKPTATDDTINLPTLNFDWSVVVTKTTIEPTGPLIPKTAAVSSTSPTPNTNTNTNTNTITNSNTNINNPTSDSYTYSAYPSSSAASKNTFQLISLQILVFVMVLWSSLFLLL